MTEIQCVSKIPLQLYSKCYCVASVMKTFTLKGVETIHGSTPGMMDSLHAFRCIHFRNIHHAVKIWNTTVKLFF
jgi:hypothetical protein